jgi:hypothetical protein
MPTLLERLRTWRLAQRRKAAVIERALLEFRTSRNMIPLGAHVLRLDPPEAIVRVTYFTNHIPPDRAWYAVSDVDGTVRELSFEDVALLESPWR